MGAILLNPIAITGIRPVLRIIRDFYPVQDLVPTLVLIFGPFDPSGSSSLPADAVTCAALGGHALSALTAVHVQDTAGTQEIQVLAPELVDDQARCLLEDMAVQAIKIGPLYTSETVSVLAQIAADYSHMPLVLHLSALPDELILDEEDAEEVLGALFQLLLPQADVVVAEHGQIVRWQTEGVLPADGAAPEQALLELGAQWALLSGAPMRMGHGAYFLHGQDNQTFHWPWKPGAVRAGDADGLLACSLALQMARGLPVPAAAEQAVRQATVGAGRFFQPGMGQRLIHRSWP